MLRNRLLFGTLMTLFFAALMIVDGWLDGSITTSIEDDKPWQGTLLVILISLLAIPAQLEIANLAVRNQIRIFIPIALIGSILFATAWYWNILLGISLDIYFLYLTVFLFFLLVLYQYFHYGKDGVFCNCGANLFSIIYLGLFSGFVLAIRVDFGLWELLMFIFVVKTADIGAYTIGRLFGKTKFSPRLSQGKTWEGFAGAIFFGIILSVLFALTFDIMELWYAGVFGICIAVMGQFADLTESLLKRQAQQKDSDLGASAGIPGFGGFLDVIDSPLGAAPFAYLLFLFLC